MKSNKNSFFRGVSMLLIIFALTFSTNAQAKITSISITSSSTTLIATSSDLNMIPAQIHSLTWGSGWWRWIKRWWNNNCQTCGSTSCGGHNHGGGEESGGGNNGGNGGDAVPLDGGLGILALGAAAFGVRKLRGNKHDKI